MVITRLNFETELNDRKGGIVALTKRDATPSGTNPVYNGAAQEALRAVGISPAAYTVTDSDFAFVADASIPEVFDVGEYRLLKSLLGWLSSPDQKVSLGEQRWGQLRANLTTEAASLLTQLQAQYGYGAPSVGNSTISLDFESTWDLDGDGFDNGVQVDTDNDGD